MYIMGKEKKKVKSFSYVQLFVTPWTVAYQVQSLGQKNLLEKEMATHSSILACKVPRTVEPGRLQSMGLQRVGRN